MSWWLAALCGTGRTNGSSVAKLEQTAIVPKALGTVTLIWLLICMGALTLPSSAWINDKAIAVGLALGLFIWLATRKSRRIPGTQPEASELTP